MDRKHTLPGRGVLCHEDRGGLFFVVYSFLAVRFEYEYEYHILSFFLVLLYLNVFLFAFFCFVLCSVHTVDICIAPRQ